MLLSTGIWNAVCYQLEEPQKQIDKQGTSATPMMSRLPAFFARKKNYEPWSIDASLKDVVLR